MDFCEEQTVPDLSTVKDHVSVSMDMYLPIDSKSTGPNQAIGPKVTKSSPVKVTMRNVSNDVATQQIRVGSDLDPEDKRERMEKSVSFKTEQTEALSGRSVTSQLDELIDCLVNDVILQAVSTMQSSSRKSPLEMLEHGHIGQLVTVDSSTLFEENQGKITNIYEPISDDELSQSDVHKAVRKRKVHFSSPLVSIKIFGEETESQVLDDTEPIVSDTEEEEPLSLGEIFDIELKRTKKNRLEVECEADGENHGFKRNSKEFDSENPEADNLQSYNKKFKSIYNFPHPVQIPLLSIPQLQSSMPKSTIQDVSLSEAKSIENNFAAHVPHHENNMIAKAEAMWSGNNPLPNTEQLESYGQTQFLPNRINTSLNDDCSLICNESNLDKIVEQHQKAILNWLFASDESFDVKKLKRDCNCEMDHEAIAVSACQQLHQESRARYLLPEVFRLCYFKVPHKRNWNFNLGLTVPEQYLKF